MSGYVAYIDESGDEGFQFLDNERGSSRWLVLSAVICRKENDKAVIELLRVTREVLNKPARKALHFRDLKHEHRIPFARAIGAEKLRTVSIAIYKPDLHNREVYQRQKYMLYRYATRLLVERISWLCRDNLRSSDEDPIAELVFSNRSAMSYEDLCAYLLHLRDGPPAAKCRIDWGIIDPAAVRAVNHDQLAGLQIADAVATSLFFALNKNQYGETEPRYFELIQNLVYRSRGSTLGYGMKFWPDFSELKKTLDHLAAIERFL